MTRRDSDLTVTESRSSATVEITQTGPQERAAIAAAAPAPARSMLLRLTYLSALVHGLPSRQRHRGRPGPSYLRRAAVRRVLCRALVERGALRHCLPRQKQEAATVPRALRAAVPCRQPSPAMNSAALGLPTVAE